MEWLCVRGLVLLCACLIAVQGSAFVRLCYFPNWAHQRVSPYARFDVNHIDPALCTHVVYAFAAIDVVSGRLVPYYQDEDSAIGHTTGRYQKFNDMKRTNKHLKTLIAIGGELAGSDKFLAITKDDKTLQTFAQTTVDFLRKRGFDGLDVDWEYPNATTKAQFSRLLKTLRTAFDADPTPGHRLLLTVALAAGRHRIQEGYDMAVIDRYVDLASLMTYDYHGSWNTITGFNSPLFSRRSKPQFNQELSTEWTVDFYISQGLAANKILVGVTAAGTRFELQELNVTGVGAPVIHSDRPRLSDLWLLPDRFAYPEICRVLQAANSHRVFDEEQQVPYVYLDQDWSGYEDIQSIQRKTEWMVKKGVAGMMFWSLDMDDFTGKLCDQGPSPLLTTVARTLVRLEGPRPLTKDVNLAIRYLTHEGDTAGGVGERGGWRVCLGAMMVVVVLGWFGG